jgi:hypothetical protein
VRGAGFNHLRPHSFLKLGFIESFTFAVRRRSEHLFNSFVHGSFLLAIGNTVSALTMWEYASKVSVVPNRFHRIFLLLDACPSTSEG